MASKVDLCNMALMTLGNSDTIGALDENSKEARALSAFCDLVRDIILRVFPWNWARRRVALTLQGDPPSTWGFSYAYPSDCLQVLGLVLPGARIPRKDQAPAYEVATNGAGRVIYTDLQDAELVYTSRVEVTAWDPLAQEAFVQLLAAKVAMPLAVKADLAKGCMNAYQITLSTAGAQNLNEGWDTEPECEYLASRR